MEKELKILATTDPLTGVKNRRSFIHSFEQEHSRAQRHSRHLSLMMIDVDHFKNINDSYGHDFGDKVLKQLVSGALSLLRNFDLFGRWGGDEFIALLPETDIHQANVIAERLRNTLAQSELRSDKGNTVKLTVSIGITEVKGQDVQFDDILKTADKALYQAKSKGRNQVVLAGSL